MSRSEEELEKARQERQRTSDLIVESASRKKLVVAGPGTGKTHNFRRVLDAAGGGLALTFIRALRTELERDLGDLAQVNTFHGYCKHLAHALGGVEGLSADFHYYPLLKDLVAQDLAALGHGGVKPSDIDHLYSVMDESNGILATSLEIGNYYDAVGHTDVVYRVQKHLEKTPDAVPAHPVIVVDEYQDFNLLDTRLIDTIAQKSPILLAGDDDQALYSFRDASPEFIRELAQGTDIARFDLPYCSRCTEVVVGAVNELVREAQRRGNLADRVDRQYLCYLPEKAEASEAHPKLIHAACTVDSAKSPLMRRYVAGEIAAIPDEDIRLSREKGHATALVIGPAHWVEPIYGLLKERGEDAVFRRSEDLTMHPLDGYRLLARSPSSRLGWRILLHLDPSSGLREILEMLHLEGAELSDLLEAEYTRPHLSLASLVAKIQAEKELDETESDQLTNALGMDIEDIRAYLSAEPGTEESASLEGESEQADPGGPSIICTTLVGAKGLSAEHVFIVGL